jgi:hypothetical protein
MSVTPLHAPDPAAELKRMDSLADQIRYACARMDGEVTTAGARAWLGVHGVTVPDKRRPYTSRVVSAWRDVHSTPTVHAAPGVHPPTVHAEPVHVDAPVNAVHVDTPAPVHTPAVHSDVHAATPVSVHTDTPGTAVHQDRSRARWAALIAPLLLVNGVAGWGQTAWALEHVTPHLVLAVAVAVTIESIGVYLAFEAHSALMAGDAALRLRLGSYLVGLLAGTLNYWHFAPTPVHPTAEAVTFGVLSAVSPWLWAIRSRSLSREQLRAQGLIDPRSVKFTSAQWLWFPVQSLRALRQAVWAGETNPAKARELVVPKVGK